MAIKSLVTLIIDLIAGIGKFVSGQGQTENRDFAFDMSDSNKQRLPSFDGI